MKDSNTPKTLLMLVNKQWLVESITSLGSGYLIHLAYKNEYIDPLVLTDIKSEQGISKVLGEIIFKDLNNYQRIAGVEVVEVNDFNTFIRFDLRLLEVSPFLRGKWTDSETNYLCYYQRQSV
jgi:dihydrofolate reductase